MTIAGLRQLLKPFSFISVTGVSSDDESTLSALEDEEPHVLVLSASSEADVHVIAREARASNGALKIVVLVDEILAVRLAGTTRTRLEGILIRGGDSLQDIGAVLRIVHQGGRVTSSYDAGPGARSPSISPELAARLQALSVRESVILRELANGRTNAEIARPLHVSVATIKSDLARIMSIMGTSSRVDLAVLAVRSGFIGETAPSPAERDAHGERYRGTGRGRSAGGD